MVTFAVAIVGGVAAVSTVVAMFVRANTPVAKSGRIVDMCDHAIHELEQRIQESGIIPLRRSA